MSDIHAKESVKQYLAGVASTITPEIVRSLKRGYTRKDFTSDLMSGLIVGILALPLAIAFAIASGVGPEQGLYTAIIAGFIISLLGGSRYQIGGPTGAFIVIVYGIVSQYGYVSGDGGFYGGYRYYHCAWPGAELLRPHVCGR